MKLLSKKSLPSRKRISLSKEPILKRKIKRLNNLRRELRNKGVLHLPHLLAQTKKLKAKRLRNPELLILANLRIKNLKRVQAKESQLSSLMMENKKKVKLLARILKKNLPTNRKESQPERTKKMVMTKLRISLIQKFSILKQIQNLLKKMMILKLAITTKMK